MMIAIFESERFDTNLYYNKSRVATIVFLVFLTLFEIFIFRPKIQLWFTEKIIHFLGGEKLVKMLWFWTF